MEAKKKQKCYNCKHAGNQFKIHKLTHIHCNHPTEYTQEKFDNEEFTAWDTLHVFSSCCELHEYK